MRPQAQTAPLAVEMLVSADSRRSAPMIDEAAADPIFNHVPQPRSQQSTARLLSILDSLSDLSESEEREDSP